MNRSEFAAALRNVRPATIVDLDLFDSPVADTPVRVPGPIASLRRRSFLKRLAVVGLGAVLIDVEPLFAGDEVGAESGVSNRKQVESPSVSEQGHESTEKADDEPTEQEADPARMWKDGRQIVVAYKRGESLGAACRRLDEVRDQLPVHVQWQLPPDWVRVFPTIHFESSDRKWQVYKGWRGADHFVTHYGRFYPPPKCRHSVSPFKEFAADYEGRPWTYPGEIAEHLTSPDARHQFSRYEIAGLTVEEMEKLHAAHHDKRVRPGRRPKA